MGKIVVNTNVSMDGVVEDPTGEDGLEHGGWFLAMSAADHEAWAKLEFEESLRTDAILLGRRTDVWFASRWHDREGEWADRLNGLPKYVVSSTLTESIWANGTVLSGDVVAEVRQLKESVDGEIAVYGSRQLVHTLLEHDLVDELRLIVFGSIVGEGGRLLGETGTAATLLLTSADRIGEALLFLTYDVVHG